MECAEGRLARAGHDDAGQEPAVACLREYGRRDGEKGGGGRRECAEWHRSIEYVPARTVRPPLLPDPAGRQS